MLPLLFPVAIIMTTTPDLPPWFLALPVREGFVYGVGMGQDAKSAEGDARHQIALRLSSSIRGEFAGEHTEVRTPYAGEGFDKKSLTITLASAVEKLPAVHITHRDFHDGTHYALAALDLQEALAGVVIRLTEARAFLANSELTRGENVPVERRLRLIGGYRRAMSDMACASRMLSLLAPSFTGVTKDAVMKHLDGCSTLTADYLTAAPVRRATLIGPNGDFRSQALQILTQAGIAIGDRGEVIFLMDETVTTDTVYGIPTKTLTLKLQVKVDTGATIFAATETIQAPDPQKARKDFLTRHLNEWLGLNANQSGPCPAT